MPNTFNTFKNAPGQIAALAAAMLADKVQFVKTIDKVPESEFASKKGYETGDTIYISKPPRFIPGSTADITSTIQDITYEKVPLTLNVRRVVAVQATTAELATETDLKVWANQILEPAVSAIAQYVEFAFLQSATRAVSNYVGTPGSTVFDTATLVAANQKISEFACPSFSNRFALLTPSANSSAVNARKGLFQSSEKIKEQYEEGMIGTGDGFTYLMNNLLYSHTTGTATVASNALSANMTNATASVSVNGLTGTNTVTNGTVITIAGVNAVHPITKADLGYLQQFVVTADATATAGAATLAISPTPFTSASGSLQNVTAIANSGATVTFVTGAASTTLQNSLAFHKSAFRCVSVPLVLPGGLDMAAQETVEGLTIRVVRDYEPLTDRLIMRLDFLGGIVPVRPEWACRITA